MYSFSHNIEDNTETDMEKIIHYLEDENGKLRRCLKMWEGGSRNCNTCSHPPECVDCYNQIYWSPKI
jgi:hypothetical protein